MSKFDHLQSGDTVLVPQTLYFGSVFSNNKKIFYLPKEIQKITKTLLILKGGARFKKDTGESYGSNNLASQIYLESEKPNETSAMQDFKAKRETLLDYTDRLHNLYNSSRDALNTDMPLEKYQELLKTIKKTEEIFNNLKKEKN